MSFSQYPSMVDHYADLARQAGVSTFFVGSEMSDSIDFTDSWRQIVSSARQHFGGPVGYEVDWRRPAQFSWGDAVDVIALSAYFPLSNAAHPTLRQLEAGWHSYRYPGQRGSQDAFASVAALAQRWGKPIIFGDVGYRASTYPAREPSQNASHPADPKAQYLAYRALLDTFARQSWWGGVMWWAWNDVSERSPESKPAETAKPAAPAQSSGKPDNIKLTAWFTDRRSINDMTEKEAVPEFQSRNPVMSGISNGCPDSMTRDEIGVVSRAPASLIDST